MKKAKQQTQNFITVIIKNSHDVSAITSLLNQEFKNWQCIIINNKNPKALELTDQDARFTFVDGDINDAIELVTGYFVMIINSNEILHKNAFFHITRMCALTNADVSKYTTDKISKMPALYDQKERSKFKYIFKKSEIIPHAFDSLSEFCFKTDFIKNQKFEKSESVFVSNLLINANTMAITPQICLYTPSVHALLAKDYRDLVDNFKVIHNDYSDAIWHKYFRAMIPGFIARTTKNDDRETFVYCCKNTPLKYVPLKYRIIFFILKITSR